MRKGTVLSLKKIRLVDFIGDNKTLIAVIIFFATGVLFSAVLTGNNEVFAEFGKEIFEVYRKQHFDLGFLSVFSNSLILNLLVLCVCFTVGTSMLGVILAPMLCLLYGAVIGSLASFLCITYSLKGIAFNAVVLIPGFIIAVVALLFAAKESIVFSYAVSKITFPGNPHNDLPFKFKGLCVKYVIMVIAAVFSALLDAAFSCSLTKIFGF